MQPSETMATTLVFSPFWSRATAMPRAAEMAVEACPAPKASYGGLGALEEA